MTWNFYNNRGVLKQDGLPDPIPVGLTVPFVSNGSPSPTVPTGWLLCDGTTHPTASYPELAAILAYPAAPGVNFTLPNFASRLPVGVSGGYPLNTTGGTSTHPHSITSHSHTNNHTHTVANHVHGLDHSHSWGSGHTHGVTGYNTGSATNTKNAYLVADTVTSLGSHTHNLTGQTGDPVTSSLSPTTSAVHPRAVTTESMNSGSDGADTSDAEAVSLPTVAPTLAASGNILPPYLNVYFIIKAVDFSGTYI